MKKSVFIFSVLCFFAAFTACKDDDSTTTDTYVVTIEILHPTAQQVVPVNQAADIHVKFSRPDDKTIHNVHVEVLDSDDNVLATLADDHAHAKGEHEVEGTFTPTYAGTFKVRAETTDDDGLNPNTETISFKAQ